MQGIRRSGDDRPSILCKIIFFCHEALDCLRSVHNVIAKPSTDVIKLSLSVSWSASAEYSVMSETDHGSSDEEWLDWSVRPECAGSLSDGCGLSLRAQEWLAPQCRLGSE